MSHRRNGARKEVAEGKEGPLELSREEGKGKSLWGGEERDGKDGMWGPGGQLPWVLCLKGVYLEVSAEHPNRIFISLPGEAFKVIVSTDRWAPGQGVIRQCSWS